MSQKQLVRSQMASTSTTSKTLIGVANLIKLLPTRTVILFQFLNPVLTNDGNCKTVNKYLEGILIVLCGFPCFFSSFTDSYTDQDGVTHYGVATKTGLWTCPSTTEDLSAYKLQVGDFVHAMFAMLVFGVVVLLNPYSGKCYYPVFESKQKVLLMVLPPVVGTISGSVFVAFPCKRHGKGMLEVRPRNVVDEYIQVLLGLYL